MSGFEAWASQAGEIENASFPPEAVRKRARANAAGGRQRYSFLD